MKLKNFKEEKSPSKFSPVYLKLFPCTLMFFFYDAFYCSLCILLYFVYAPLPSEQKNSHHALTVSTCQQRKPTL